MLGHSSEVLGVVSECSEKAETFTGLEGRYVPLEETLKGFEALLGGELDKYPESAFSMVGTVDEVREKARAQGAI